MYKSMRIVTKNCLEDVGFFPASHDIARVSFPCDKGVFVIPVTGKQTGARGFIVKREDTWIVIARPLTKGYDHQNFFSKPSNDWLGYNGVARPDMKVIPGATLPTAESDFMIHYEVREGQEYEVLPSSSQIWLIPNSAQAVNIGTGETIPLHPSWEYTSFANAADWEAIPDPLPILAGWTDALKHILLKEVRAVAELLKLNLGVETKVDSVGFFRPNTVNPSNDNNALWESRGGYRLQLDDIVSEFSVHQANTTRAWFVSPLSYQMQWPLLMPGSLVRTIVAEQNSSWRGDDNTIYLFWPTSNWCYTMRYVNGVAVRDVHRWKYPDGSPFIFSSVWRSTSPLKYKTSTPSCSFDPGTGMLTWLRIGVKYSGLESLNPRYFTGFLIPLDGSQVHKLAPIIDRKSVV